jgi:hypothetical protein
MSDDHDEYGIVCPSYVKSLALVVALSLTVDVVGGPAFDPASTKAAPKPRQATVASPTDSSKRRMGRVDAIGGLRARQSPVSGTPAACVSFV